MSKGAALVSHLLAFSCRRTDERRAVEAQLKSERAEHQRRTEALHATVEEERRASQSLSSQLQDATSRADALEQQVCDTEATVARLEEQIRSRDARLQSLEASLSEAHAQIVASNDTHRAELQSAQDSGERNEVPVDLRFEVARGTGGGLEITRMTY